MGAVPSVAAAHSAPVPGNVPLWTPPETPLPSGAGMGAAEGTVRVGASSEVGLIRRTHSASSSVSGVVAAGFVSAGLARRDSELSEREKDVVGGEGEKGRKREGDDEGGQMQGAKTKRKVAPTLVSVPAVAGSPSESAVSGTMDPPSVPPSAEP